MSDEAKKESHENRDPLTGEPGSHPVGSGVGAASAGAAGAAIGGIVGGPVGVVVGAVVGGAIGGYGGHGVAEAVNPTDHEQYWRANHSAEPWTQPGESFEHYAPAYRTGYEGFPKYMGRTFDDSENDLARDYEKNDANPAIPWDRARPAVRAAWDRVAGVVAPRDTDRGLRGGL